jgi:hypothetical protein
MRKFVLVLLLFIAVINEVAAQEVKKVRMESPKVQKDSLGDSVVTTGEKKYFGRYRGRRAGNQFSCRALEWGSI